jgi:hypothetical protein
MSVFVLRGTLKRELTKRDMEEIYEISSLRCA